MKLMDSLSLWGLPSCPPWSEFDQGSRPLRAALRFAAMSGEVQGSSLLLLASWALLFLCLYQTVLVLPPRLLSLSCPARPVHEATVPVTPLALVELGLATLTAL